MASVPAATSRGECSKALASFIRMGLGATANFRAIAAKASVRAVGNAIHDGRLMEQGTASLLSSEAGAQSCKVFQILLVGRRVKQGKEQVKCWGFRKQVLSGGGAVEDCHSCC